MQRSLIIAFGAFGVLLAATLLFLMLRDQPRAAPVSINAADENAVDPDVQEMSCIDRLMQNNDLMANQVGAELARCQGAAPESLSNGQ